MLRLAAPPDLTAQGPRGPIQQIARSLASLSQLSRRLESFQSPALGGELGPRDAQDATRATACPSSELTQHGRHLGSIGHDQLRRRRRRGCANVGREVREGHVHLMADAANHRHRVGHDGPDDPLIVERPQILQRPAAAGQDDHCRRIVRPTLGATYLAPAGQPIERRHDARGRSLALDLTRREDEPGKRPAPCDDVADVMPDGARCARRNADDGGALRQRPFPAALEEALGGELRL